MICISELSFFAWIIQQLPYLIQYCMDYCIVIVHLFGKSLLSLYFVSCSCHSHILNSDYFDSFKFSPTICHRKLMTSPVPRSDTVHSGQHPWKCFVNAMPFSIAASCVHGSFTTDLLFILYAPIFTSF